LTRIGPEDIARRVEYIAGEEKLELTSDGAELIARLADGALRDALSILDTCAGVTAKIDADVVRRMAGVTDRSYLFHISDALEAQDAAAALAQLAQLRHSCEAFRTGELRVLRAEDGILHYQRIGKTETAEIIVNRSEHIIVEPLASGKHTEVNPMGFTIVVEENGHNPNHSYYDIQ